MPKLNWEAANTNDKMSVRDEAEVVAWWWVPARFPSQCETCSTVTPKGGLVAWNHYMRVAKCEPCGELHGPRMGKRAQAHVKQEPPPKPSHGGAPSPREVLAARTPKGAWTAHQLAQWGVPWPAPKGWRKALERCHRTGQPYVPPPPKPGRYPHRGEHAADMAAMKARNAARASIVLERLSPPVPKQPEG